MLLRTIKYIDDLVDKNCNIIDVKFNIVIDDKPIKDNFNHEGILLKNKLF
jgi:hypothetical protein